MTTDTIAQQMVCGSPNTTDLLAAFAACTDHTGYWRAFVAVESRLNYLDDNGRSGEAVEYRREFTRINRQVVPRLEAVATLNSIAAMVSNDILGSYLEAAE